MSGTAGTIWRIVPIRLSLFLLLETSFSPILIGFMFTFRTGRCLIFFITGVTILVASSKMSVNRLSSNTISWIFSKARHSGRWKQIKISIEWWCRNGSQEFTDSLSHSASFYTKKCTFSGLNFSKKKKLIPVQLKDRSAKYNCRYSYYQTPRSLKSLWDLSLPSEQAAVSSANKLHNANIWRCNYFHIWYICWHLELLRALPHVTQTVSRLQ